MYQPGGDAQRKWRPGRKLQGSAVTITGVMNDLRRLLAISDGPAVEIDWAAELATRGRALRLVILARVRDRHAADEVMQEVALAAVSQKAPIRDHHRIGAWLRQLAVRQALLYRRGRGRGHKLLIRHAGRSADRDGFSAEPEPLDWLVRDERSALVRAALSGCRRATPRFCC